MAAKKNSFGIIIVLIIIIIAAIVAVIVLNHNSGSLSTSQQSSDKNQITTNWEQFFAYSTPLSQRENLLQNGKQFSSIITSEFQSLASAKSSVTINNIDLTNSTSAKVTYTIDLNGQAVLSDQTGTALKVNNSWVVSDSTLCGLLGLAGSKPAACLNT